MELKAALFDLDGTLFDSMWIWERLTRDFMERHQLVPDPQVEEKVSHMSLKQSSVYVRDFYNLSMTSEEILAEWREMVYYFYAEKVALKPGAKEYLSLLKERGIRIGVVTACDATLCTACMKNNGIYEWFDAITFVDEVGKDKSFPDIYIECLNRLDCKVEDAVLFEDILVGVRTAKKIGLRVVAIEDTFQDNREQIQEEADLYIRDFYALQEL